MESAQQTTKNGFQDQIKTAVVNVLRSPKLPLSLRKKIGKVLSFEKGQPFEVQVFEHRYKGRHGIHMDDKIFRYGLHEPATIRLIRHILQTQKKNGRRAVYMDIGTNTGLHLIAAAGVADEVYGFEPWEEVRDKAYVNLAANDLDHIQLFDFGLSNKDASVPFAAPDGNNLGVGYITDGSKEDAVQVKVHQGDKVAQKFNIRPSLMKIDVEGHEKSVLEGLRETIDHYKPEIIFEYSDVSRQTLGTEEARHKLFGEDYRFYGILRSREYPKLEPFKAHKKYENVLAVPISQPPSS